MRVGDGRSLGRHRPALPARKSIGVRIIPAHGDIGVNGPDADGDRYAFFQTHANADSTGPVAGGLRPLAPAPVPEFHADPSTIAGRTG